MVLFACIILCHCVERLMSYNCFQGFVQSVNVGTRKAKFCGIRCNIWKEVEEKEVFDAPVPLWEIPMHGRTITHNLS